MHPSGSSGSAARLARPRTPRAATHASRGPPAGWVKPEILEGIPRDEWHEEIGAFDADADLGIDAAAVAPEPVAAPAPDGGPDIMSMADAEARRPLRRIPSMNGDNEGSVNLKG